MKKALSLVLAAALSLTVFASCGQKPASTPASTPATTPESKPASKPSGDKVTLVYWPMWSETEPQGKVISEAAAAYTEKTGVEVEIKV